MKDSSESLFGRKIVQGGRDARVLFRVPSLGGIQPEGVMGATSCIGLYASMKLVPKEVREAGTDTPC